MWADMLVELLKRPLRSGMDISDAVTDLGMSVAKEALREIPAANRAGICILDQEDKTLSIVSSGDRHAIAGRGWSRAVLAGTIAPKSGAAQAVRTGRPVLINQSRKTAEFFLPDARSHVSVPLLWRKQTAVLSLEALRRGAFTKKDVRLLQSLTADMLMVLEQFAHTEDKWHLELDGVISSSATIAALCERATRHILQIFGARSGCIFLLHPSDSVLRLAPGATLDKSIASSPVCQMGQGHIGWVAKNRRPLRLRNIENEPKKAWKPGAKNSRSGGAGSSSTSFLAVPLIAQENLVGVLCLQGKGGSFFTSQDTSLLASIAGRLSLAVANIWFRQEARQHVQLDELSKSIAGVRSVVGVAARVVDRSLQIFGANSGHIRVFDRENQNLKLVHSLGLPSLPEHRELGVGLAGTAAQTRKPIIIPDTGLDPRFLGFAGETLQMSHDEVAQRIRSEACVPLMFRNRFIGTLNLHSSSVGTFGPHNKKFLLELAGRCAVALNAALAFEELKRVLRFLREIGLEFGGSPNLDKFLTSLLEHALKLSGYAWGTVRTISADGKVWELRAAAHHSGINMQIVEPLSVVRDDFLHRAANGRKTRKVPNAREDAEFQTFLWNVPLPSHRQLLAQVSSCLVVPMRLGERSLGFIFLGITRTDEYQIPETTVKFLEILGTEAALAIENETLNGWRAEREGIAFMNRILGHTLRDPIMRIDYHATKLCEDTMSQKHPGEVRSPAELILDDVRSIGAFCDAMLDVKEKLDLKFDINVKLEKVEVRELLTRCMEQFQYDAQHGKINFDLECPMPLTVIADPNLLKYSVEQLVQNSVEALEEALAKGVSTAPGRISLSVRVDGAMAAIKVIDNGPGIPEGMRAHIFDSLVTTKRHRGSLIGLGVFTVKHFMHAQNGSVELVPEVQQGAQFILRIPLPRPTDGGTDMKHMQAASR